MALTIGLVAGIVSALLALWYKENLPKSPLVLDDEYDYVIIGGGPGGCVMANRLSEDPKVQVLLIEAGGYESPVTDIPSAFLLLQNTAVDWGIRSIPQENCCAASPEQKVELNTGKALGGSTVINAMMYVRGNGIDFKQWVDAGAEGWSYQDTLPYFHKVEDMGIKDLRNDPYHHTGGYLKLNHPHYVTQLGEAFVKAGSHLGYEAGDYNGAKPNSFSITQSTTWKGSRQSAAKSYITPIKNRKNLKVVTYATAHKILFDKDSKAEGVIFNRMDTDHTVKARKEVILAAGALQSPKILMQSGIGPQDHLNELNIPVVKHLPGVGQNLQDHPRLEFDFSINATAWSAATVTTAPTLASYLTAGKGPLASNLAEAMGFIHTDKGPSYPFPNMQLISFATNFMTENHKFSILNVLLNPVSRGTLKLKSSDWKDNPIVDPKYYSAPEDLETYVKALELTIKLTEAPSFARFNPKVVQSSAGGCDKFEAPSTDYLRCFARENLRSLYHYSGTCKIGSPSDEMAVVDPQLQVIGVKGLRVVDASVMPIVVSANTQATTYMIGEKAADMIKGNTLEPSKLKSGDI
ncbi:Glucose dehydrogenase -like protein [Halotydeus destructor]|nr:Glucose dehydrogenase -like protein [Halotydeus destructor]